jgi:hypothetical protein
MAINTTSFTKTPQAQDDSYTFTEDQLLAPLSSYNNATNVVTLDVMSNDLGGNAKSLYSIDDGSAGFLTDLLTNNVNTGWELTANGDLVRIFNGKILLDITYQLQGFGVGLNGVNGLAEGDHIHDTFDYAIQLGNGTLSWAKVSVDIWGRNDAATITGNDTGTVTEDGTLTATGVLVASDVDHGQNSF